jgi:hypothetical protein
MLANNVQPLLTILSLDLPFPVAILKSVVVEIKKKLRGQYLRVGE